MCEIAVQQNLEELRYVSPKHMGHVISKLKEHGVDEFDMVTYGGEEALKAIDAQDCSVWGATLTCLGTLAFPPIGASVWVIAGICSVVEVWEHFNE